MHWPQQTEKKPPTSLQCGIWASSESRVCSPSCTQVQHSVFKSVCCCWRTHPRTACPTVVLKSEMNNMKTSHVIGEQLVGSPWCRMGLASSEQEQDVFHSRGILFWFSLSLNCRVGLQCSKVFQISVYLPLLLLHCLDCVSKRGELKQDDVQWNRATSCFLIKSRDVSSDWGQYEQNKLLCPSNTHRFSKHERNHKSKLVLLFHPPLN